MNKVLSTFAFLAVIYLSGCAF
ncbi:lipoprotein [Snodgrassella sp. B3882]|nr:lipoprotein [Snodgrassella sp. B3882]